ncbi:Fpg/Nei family DNA glycosylase [Jatrophihabitans sp.]|uniref:Fpg/Nei family DNA glycosylase n=1 Tax=Jatrophihabitans sp. TaxID=1932789 RepID=UPI002B6A6218|nr:DNA-formamidopyrimidine glycosylase family protein [Jatrophihabitans sp.]
MPEGHTLHRLAREQHRLFGGRPVRASSPQGRFAEGAGAIDGRVLRRVEANGKHLLQYYQHGPVLHVHLGLYGSFTTGSGLPPEPKGALRLRLVGQDAWTDLRGATICELLERDQVAALFARLGPDPLRRDADPMLAYRRISRSQTVIAALLMDQQVVAGIGNVYRAELLYRHALDPYLPGRALSLPVWLAMWADLVALMRHGVRVGRIETLRPADRPRKRGRLARDEAGYVYRRAGLPCRVCGTEVRTAELVGRNLYWCPFCQPPGSAGRQEPAGAEVLTG